MADRIVMDQSDDVVAERYRLEELAAAVGVGVDTIRYYQARGLLDRPAREGRIGWYSPAHRERIERVRDLSSQGFTLAQISDLIEAETVDSNALDTEKAPTPEPERDALLRELADRSAPDPDLHRHELATRSGMSSDLVDLAVDAGLLSPVQIEPVELFASGAVDMLRAGRELLDAGLPLEELAALAVGHAQHVEALVDRAIELVDRQTDASDLDREQLAVQVRQLVPAVTTLVASHFERTLLDRALDRAEGGRP